ncbi:DUF4055 domain-containing protein [Collimonas humicola]|uniref:DUF4055 domain-containing protein n=1 Tax=Collimonas humicola TaxID=2825886 RepID=UPI001B8CAB40|nr:DUF4055 domain-containing protein [Collimonas humicola]
MANATVNNKTVTTEHKDYTAMKEKWQRCRDVAAGQDAIRKNGLSYLPQLADQTPEAYQAYLTRAAFFNATWRTISGLSGMLFRKPEIIEAPAGIKDYLEDVTMGGEPLHIFAQEVARECMTVGRCGLLVDFPVVDRDGIITVARAQAMGLRPTLQRYTAESIINWRTGAVNNITKLLMVVLTEEATVKIDEFASEAQTQYRVLDLTQDPADATKLAYRVRLFKIDKASDSQVQIGEDQIPLMNGQPLREIPIAFLGVDCITTDIQLPPLIDLVDLNIAHFRVSADYEHGCHFTGLPTPYVCGYTPSIEGEKLYIGSASAWVFQDAATRVGYLEFGGGGLGALERNLDRKEAQMAAIGARLLAADKRLNETATTAAIHHGGETSILSAIAQVLSLGITKTLTIFAEWAGAAGKVSYDINRDFFPVPMDAPTLQALVGAWQAGAISSEVLFENLQEGEIISSTATFEKEQAKIANAPPISSRMTTNKVALTADELPATSGTVS